MHVRKAFTKDLTQLMEIYAYARKIMIDSGNLYQWADDKPSEAQIITDIQNEHCYLIEEDGQIVGVFAFIIGMDPSYTTIEGNWLDEAPYGTIHRLASSGTAHGIFAACINFCQAQIKNLRIDTHHDNQIMRSLIKKHNFSQCGIITLADNSKRIAFQLSLS